MGFIGSLIAGAASGTIKGTFEGIGSLARDLRVAITGKLDPEKEASILEKVANLEHMAQMGQIEVNKAEATHQSVFVSGWRPSIGWICSLALGFYFIPQYAMATVLWVKMSWAAQVVLEFPIGEPRGLLELVIGMLGLGALRTVERLAGKEKN